MKHRRRPWTADEERALFEGAGAFALPWFDKRVGASWDYPGAPPRSRRAIYKRARKLWGAGGLRRGVFSMRQLCLHSGYSVGQIKRAQSALNHKYKRLSTHGPYMVSYEQREDIYAWLAHDFWAKGLRLYNCTWCGLHTLPHKGYGLCSRCYYAHRRLCARLYMPPTLDKQIAGLQGHPDLQDAVRHLQRGLALLSWQLSDAASHMERNLG